LQHSDESEEDSLVRIPRQDSIDQASASADQLTRQTYERLHECLELQSQHPLLFFNGLTMS